MSSLWDGQDIRSEQWPDAMIFDTRTGKFHNKISFQIHEINEKLELTFHSKGKLIYVITVPIDHFYWAITVWNLKVSIMEIFHRLMSKVTATLQLVSPSSWTLPENEVLHELWYNLKSPLETVASVIDVVCWCTDSKFCFVTIRDSFIYPVI